jgi:hypothetical protein
MLGDKLNANRNCNEKLSTSVYRHFVSYSADFLLFSSLEEKCLHVVFVLSSESQTRLIDKKFEQ